MTEKGCKQCGKCCSVIGIKIAGVISKEAHDFYVTIGCSFGQDTLFIPHVCPHLLRQNKHGKRLCDIHSTAPRACRAYEGKRFDNTGLESVIFEGCGYNEV